MTDIRDQITSARFDNTPERAADIADSLANIVDDQAAQLAAANTAPLVFEVDPDLDPEAIAGRLPEGVILIERGGPVRLLNGTVARTEPAAGPSREDMAALDNAVGKAVRRNKERIYGSVEEWHGDLDDLYDLVADWLASWDRAQADAAPEVDEPDGERPETPYGVRLTYADGSGEDIHDVHSVQVYDTRNSTFPFGFVPVEGDGEEPQHRAVWWRHEDGELVPFSGDQQPKPFNAWGI